MNLSTTVKSGGDSVSSANNNAMRLDILKNAGQNVTTTGTGSAYIATLDSQLVAGDIVAGFRVRVKINANSLASATLRLDTGAGTILAATAIRKHAVTAIGDGDLKVDQEVEFCYDGTYWQVVSSVDEIVGTEKSWPMKTPPPGYLIEDESNVSRTTYAALFAVLVPTVGTCTVTLASPGVFTLNNHGLDTGDSVYLTTTGALPTGLAVNTLYYVTWIDANTFKLATSRANARASTNINTSGSQSGVHTLKFCPYGLGDGSTTFTLPGAKGRVIVGRDSSQTEFDIVGLTGGAKTHALTESELAAHTHPLHMNTGGGSFPGNGGNIVNGQNASLGTKAEVFVSGGVIPVQSAGSGAAHNNLQPYTVRNIIIKY